MDYDVRCLNCFHRTHEGKECPYCPADTFDNKNLRCKQFIRPDLFIATTIGRLEQGMAQSHGQFMMALSTIFDLLAEAYPQAAEALDAKLKARQKAAEEEMELQRTKALAEADQALAAAKEAEERRSLESLAEGYTERDNVIQFPVPKEVTEPTNPTDPEIV